MWSVMRKQNVQEEGCIYVYILKQETEQNELISIDRLYVFFVRTVTILGCLLAGTQNEHHATLCLNEFHWKFSCDYICS